MATTLSLVRLIAVNSVFSFATKDQLGVHSLPQPESEYWNDATASSIELDDGDEVGDNYIREANGHRMAVVRWIGTSTKHQYIDCQLYGDNIVIYNVLKDVPKYQIRFVGKDEMSAIVSTCMTLLTAKDYLYSNHSREFFAPSFNEGGSLRHLAIFPGTKWCGVGNIAGSFDDLGPSVEADKCCREHDHCYDTIDGYQNKYGLRNKAPFTKSHCHCDCTFYECLSEAPSGTAKSVGNLFFNIIQVQCFKNDYPIIKCLKYKGIPFLHWSCQEYLQDSTKPIKWQFFDAKYFKTS